MTLSDWYVYLSDKPYDSRTLAKRRGALFWISLVFLVLATVITTGAARPITGEELVTPEGIRRTLINSIEGRDPVDTNRLRGVLREVLVKQATADQWMEGAKTFKARRERFQLYLRASARLAARIRQMGQVLPELETFRHQLQDLYHLP